MTATCRAAFCWISLCLIAAGLVSGQARAVPTLEPLDHAVCRLIDEAARVNRLPSGFMTRVIWRESSFRAGAVSPAGAEGIAQFMPGTAEERGLADPFDPEQAIPKAARLLADLRRRFGNLGYAAAAYNAGAGRVDAWLKGEGGLPAATRAYVRFVTRRGLEEWREPGSTDREAETTETKAGGDAAPSLPSCLALTALLRREGGISSTGGLFAPLTPWGVQLAGNFSKQAALASFERAERLYARAIGNRRPMIIGRMLRSRGTKMFYQIRLPAASRAVAVALCGRIQAVGGACVAMHS